ncbi:MAG: putative rane protein [Lachnospiraceae bacterium]|nr:putative rane protein [Lachnospiraceae bacterium]
MKQIIKKELNRVFTDKKLIVSLFILPAVLVVGMYFFIGKMQTAMIDDIENHISSVYIQNEPEGFQDIVEISGFSANIQYMNEKEDVTEIKNGILNGTTDLLVVFEDDFLNKVENYNAGGNIPDVKTFYNPSEEYSGTARNNFLTQVLGIYQQQLLIERFGDLSQLTAFTIDAGPEESEIVDNEKATGKIAGTLLPYFITLMLFSGAMSLGVDAITGEKERGTMASMLLTPLKRKEIVLGKLFSLSILSSLSAAIYAIAMIISIPALLKNLTGGAQEGFNLSFTPVQMIELLAIMLSLVFLYVSIVSLAAVLARTAKEAATFVSPLMIIVMLAGMITMFTGNGVRQLITYAIPVYGSAISIQDLLVGELSMAKFGLTIGGTIAVALVLVALIVRAFNSEKVMFNA